MSISLGDLIQFAIAIVTGTLLAQLIYLDRIDIKGTVTKHLFVNYCNSSNGNTLCTNSFRILIFREGVWWSSNSHRRIPYQNYWGTSRKLDTKVYKEFSNAGNVRQIDFILYGNNNCLFSEKWNYFARTSIIYLRHFWNYF